MRHLLLRSLAALACLGVFSLTQASAALQPDQPDRPNFSGTFTLDLKASDSVEPLMKQIGASLLEQKFAAWITLKATVHAGVFQDTWCRRERRGHKKTVTIKCRQRMEGITEKAGNPPLIKRHWL